MTEEGTPIGAHTANVDPEFKEKVVTSVNAVIEELNARPKGTQVAYIRELVGSHAVVFGVWQDPAEPDGVGLLVVKGDRLLRTIVAQQVPHIAAIVGIPCTCIEQAIALKQVMGEPEALD